MTRRGRSFWLGGILLMLVACARQAPPEVGSVEALDVQVVVMPDGGLDVRERLQVAPDGTTVRVRRVITTPYADDVVFRSVSLDGQPVESGEAGVTVDTGDFASLVIDLERSAVQAPLELTVRYAVTAAVGVRQPRGRLAWPILESSREFDVHNVTVGLAVPDGVAIHDGTGMAEAGWDVAVAGGQVTARRARVPAAEGATLLAVFDVDRTRVQQGAWEWNLDRRQEFRFALLSAGVFIVVVGLGILAQLRAQYRPPPADAPDDVRRAAWADRQMLRRGLRLAGVVSLVVASAFSAAARWWLAGLGPALQAIPGSMAVVAVLFLAASWWYGRSAAPSTRMSQ